MLAGAARSLLHPRPPTQDPALRALWVVLPLQRTGSRMAELGWKEACL